jgi:hypothetical protein
MSKLTIIYWRDIPAQLIGQRGRQRFKQMMPERFAVAIDRAAMRAGKGSSEAYLEEWRRESRACGADVEAAMNEEVTRLDALFPDDVLETTVKAGGLLKKE